jgi:hypothetical protein
MIPSLRRVRSDDNIVRQLQDATDSVLRSISARQILDGILIEDVELDSAGDNLIEHKLGRKLRGWIVVRQNINTNVWDSQDSNLLPDKTLILNCGSDVTVSLWVF